MAHIQQQTPESIVLAGVYYFCSMDTEKFHNCIAKKAD